MKCKFFMAALAFAAILPASAQDTNMFNHVAVGVELGTNGIGFDVAAPVGNYVQVRAGFNFVPTVKAKDIEVNISDNANKWGEIKSNLTQIQNIGFLQPSEQALVNNFVNQYGNISLPNKMLVDGESSFNNFKFLVDVFPFKNSSFHVTAGFYAGNSQTVDIYSTNCQDALEAITYFNNNFAGKGYSSASHGTQVFDYTFPDKIGAKMGDYLLTPNGKQIKGYIKTAGFKPYLGVGFGRAVPSKHRFSVSCDFGAMFWGTPEIWVEQKNGDVKLEKSNVNGDGGFVKTVSKITVYPVASLRLCYRLF